MKNRKWNYYIVAFTVLLLLSACRDEKLEGALSLSGDNRQELENVLAYYKGDDLKYKAACFLISNMPGHGRYDSLSIKPLQPYYDKLRAISAGYGWEKTTAWRDSTNAYWEKVRPMALSRLSGMKADVNNLKGEWLIREIDLAFKAWQENAYSRSVSFDEFCRYILPYRIHNGICADDSRSVFYEANAGWFADNKEDFRIKVDSLLYRYKHLVHNDFAAASMPLPGFGVFQYLKRGLCDDRCKFNVALLSALGMPVVQDFVPVWGNRNGGHSWNAIVLNEESYPFEAFWDEDRWKYKKIYDNECFDLLWGKFRLPKVYRYTYEANICGPLGDQSVKRADIPPLFLNPFIRDVSSQYFKTTDVEVEITEPMPDDARYCYLCVFANKQWQPVQWGKIGDNGKVVFQGMGRDIVYLPMFCKSGMLKPAAPAFLLSQEGVYKEAACSEEKTAVTVRNYTSYLFPDEIEEAKKTLLGAYLLGGNDLNSSFTDTLSCLTDSMDAWRNDIGIGNPKGYRYIQLAVPGDSLGLCEILFYEQGREDKPVTGVKVSADLVPIKPFEKIGMMADNLSATGCIGTFNGKGNGRNIVWFDLQEARKITKITYIPYTKSYLYKGSDVELFYWDGSWVLAGSYKNNMNSYVTFDNVPKGTFYRVRDRIFTYEDGIISWY